MAEESYIFDWNIEGKFRKITNRVELDDESLRDGLQSPSTTDPPVEGKLQLVRYMEQLGIDSADVGFPGASPKMYNDVTLICEMLRDENFKILPNCAARTHENDILPIIEISQKVGIPIEVAAFIGSSPIRQYVEGWSLEKLISLSENAIRLCVDNDVPSMFVTEDTTRAHPDDLKSLYLAAVQSGAKAVCISDTVGHATPEGAYNIVNFIRRMLDDEGFKDIRIDWHGHRDRGLSLANALAAIDGGAVRIHGTGLGIGERCGNTPLDQMLVNLKLMKAPGYKTRDLSVLPQYTKLISSLVKIPIPVNYPIIGDDAFRTSTGVHAAALIKAKKLGESFADTIYSGVPASDFGLEQQIEIGPLSGMSNVHYKLDNMGFKISNEQAQHLLVHVKELGRLITDEEIQKYLKNMKYM